MPGHGRTPVILLGGNIKATCRQNEVHNTAYHVWPGHNWTITHAHNIKRTARTAPVQGQPKT
jgi:hypothetical protein